MRVLFFYVLIFPSVPMHAETYFDMDADCLEAQKNIYELKFEAAEKILDALDVKHPDNIALPWMRENILFLKLFISEDKALYQENEKAWGKLISNTEKTHFNNAWYRYILSDMHIHRGLIRLRFGENIACGSDIQTAYKYLKDNRKMFSSFLPDNMTYGLLSCAFSSVPSKYQWLAKIIGLQGDMETGLAEIEAYLNSGQTYKEHVYLRLQAAFIYASVQHHLNKNTAAAWQKIEAFTRQYKTNLLENYMRACVAGYNGDNDEMISILKHRPTQNGIYPFYFTDYLMGLAKMRRLDSDADVYFKIFTVKYKGNNYIKSAYRSLSWIAQTKGDVETAKVYYKLCSTKGLANIEEDKQAEKEALENLPWPVSLIKARLLFDGNYYEKSLQILKPLKEDHFENKRFKLELLYRLARIYDEKKEYTQAIDQYKKVIEKGKSLSYYYAAYSALLIAYIYENQKDFDSAKIYFNKAKNDFSSNKEYASTIERKAKAGLKRIGKS